MYFLCQYMLTIFELITLKPLILDQYVEHWRQNNTAKKKG